MAINLGIDKKLLEEAMKAGEHKSKKDTVNEALKEYVMRRKRRDVLSLFGKVEMKTSYDYKKERTPDEDPHVLLGAFRIGAFSPSTALTMLSIVF